MTDPARDSDADGALVSAMARGDAEALGQLYDAYAPRMLAVARRIVGSPTAAEDLVHDVFLEAWRHAAEFDPARGSVRTWLLLRARSRALDVVRSAAVAKRSNVDETTIVDELGDPGAEGASLDAARVRRALAELPAEQRSVLLLGYFEGLSSSEIASRVGTPVGTVKSRVAAALAKLRLALGRGEEPR